MNDSYFIWLANALMNHYQVKVNGLAELLKVNYSYLNRMIKHNIPSTKYLRLMEQLAREAGIEYLAEKNRLTASRYHESPEEKSTTREPIYKIDVPHDNCRYKLVIELEMDDSSVTSQKVSVYPHD